MLSVGRGCSFQPEGTLQRPVLRQDKNQSYLAGVTPDGDVSHAVPGGGRVYYGPLAKGKRHGALHLLIRVKQGQQQLAAPRQARNAGDPFAVHLAAFAGGLR